MPLKTWDKATFDATYRVGAEPEGHPNTRPEVKLHYCRAAIFPVVQRRAAELIRLLALTSGQRVAIVGAGFGWLGEVLAASGIVTASIDTSTYIQSAKSTTEAADVRAWIQAAGLDPDSGKGAEILARCVDGQARSRVTVLNEDLANNQSRNRVRTAWGGGAPTWVLTEHVLESLTDAECSTLDSRCRSLGPTAHLIEPTQTGNLPGYNRKTPAEWKTLLPNSQILSSLDWTRI